MKPYTQTIKTIILALILSFGISFVYAWVGPTATPPNGNASAPINTSVSTQYKGGALGVGGLIRGYANAIFDGNVGIGTTSPGQKLHVVNGGIGQMQLQNTAAGGGNWRMYVGDTGCPGSGILGIGPVVASGSGLCGGDLGNVLTLTTTGNVGIGTTGPVEKLEVVGNIRVNDVYITSIGKWASELSLTYLVNNLHTTTQCSASGGTVVNDGAGNKMCKLAGQSCPIGWMKYGNWTETTAQIVPYINEIVSGQCAGTGYDLSTITSQVCGTSSASCNSGNHAWGNIAKESATCNGVHALATVYYWGISGTGGVIAPGCYQGDIYPGSSCTGATNTTANAIITQIGCY